MSVRDLASFEVWLTDCGAEVLDVTSGWEVLRVRTNTGTHVVHCNKRGDQRWPESLLAIVSDFNAGRTPRLAATARGQGKSRTKQRYTALLKRDGPGCFYCGHLVPAPGEPVLPEYEPTTEHLVPRAHGGPNHISNCFLSHRICNERAGHLSAPEKIKLREKMRSEAAA